MVRYFWCDIVKGRTISPGYMGFLGGRPNEGESILAAAARELFEETGARVIEKDLYEFPDNQYTADIPRKDGTTKRFTMSFFVGTDFAGETKGSLETIPEWVKIAELDDYNLLPNVKKAVLAGAEFLKMKKPKISVIAAVAKNRAIGKDNKLLWHIPEDLQRFKKITSGHPVIMGQKTFESLGNKPLPNRTNIVLTLDKSYQAPGCVVAYSIDEAVKIASEKDPQEIFFIGGGSVYGQAIKFADKLYLTLVEGEYDADTFFPDYSDFKKVILEEPHESAGYKYKFLELEK